LIPFSTILDKLPLHDNTIVEALTFLNLPLISRMGSFCEPEWELSLETGGQKPSDSRISLHAWQM